MMNNMYNPMMMNMNNPMMMNMNMNNPMMNMNMNNPMMMNNMYNLMMMNMNNPMMIMNMMNLSNNNVQNNINNSTIIKGKNNPQLGRLPREKTTIQYKANINNNSTKSNLIFSTPAGHRTSITTPNNIKIYDLLCLYMERVGLGPNLIGNGIYFLFNGRKFKEVDYNKLVKDLFQDRSSLIVIDAGNLIGAKILS